MKFNWSPSETLFEIGGFGIHVYSLMFVIAFLLGYRICKKIFLTEGINQKYLEPLFMFMVISQHFLVPDLVMSSFTVGIITKII